jgi:hypothetical protein
MRRDAPSTGAPLRTGCLAGTAPSAFWSDADGLPADLDPRGFLLAPIAAANAPAAMPRHVRSIFDPDTDPDSAEFLRWHADELDRLTGHLAGALGLPPEGPPA